MKKVVLSLLTSLCLLMLTNNVFAKTDPPNFSFDPPTNTDDPKIVEAMEDPALIDDTLFSSNVISAAGVVNDCPNCNHANEARARNDARLKVAQTIGNALEGSPSSVNKEGK